MPLMTNNRIYVCDEARKFSIFLKDLSFFQHKMQQLFNVQLLTNASCVVCRVQFVAIEADTHLHAIQVDTVCIATHCGDAARLS